MALLECAHNLVNLGTKSKKGSWLVTLPAFQSPDGRFIVGQPGTRIRPRSITSLTQFARGAGSHATRESVRAICVGVDRRRGGERVYTGQRGRESGVGTASHGGRSEAAQ